MVQSPSTPEKLRGVCAEHGIYPKLQIQEDLVFENVVSTVPFLWGREGV